MVEDRYDYTFRVEFDDEADDVPGGYEDDLIRSFLKDLRARHFRSDLLDQLELAWDVITDPPEDLEATHDETMADRQATFVEALAGSGDHASPPTFTVGDTVKVIRNDIIDSGKYMGEVGYVGKIDPNQVSGMSIGVVMDSDERNDGSITWWFRPEALQITEE